MADKQLYVVSWIKKTNRGGQERTFFDRVGSGFQNKDGSYNIRFEKLPVGINEDTTFHIGPYKPREKVESGGFEE